MTGDLSFRRLAVLVRQLPPTSRLGAEQLGYKPWTDTEHLLAGLWDLLAGANWQRSGGKGQRPKPIKRPGDRSGETHYGKAIPIDIAKERLKRRKLGVAS